MSKRLYITQLSNGEAITLLSRIHNPHGEGCIKQIPAPVGYHLAAQAQSRFTDRVNA